MQSVDLDAMLDRILIAALFGRLNDESKKEFFASAYNLIDHLYCVDIHKGSEPDILHQRLCERLLERLPEGRQWSKSDLLNDY